MLVSGRMSDINARLGQELFRHQDQIFVDCLHSDMLTGGYSEFVMRGCRYFRDIFWQSAGGIYGH